MTTLHDVRRAAEVCGHDIWCDYNHYENAPCLCGHLKLLATLDVAEAAPAAFSIDHGVNTMPDPTPSKPILCVDFDGVLHSYTSGWQGADVVADPAVPGAAEWLEAAVEKFRVCVYSSRTSQEGGVRAMKEWCALEFGPHLTQQLEFPEQKPPAFLTIDDRAVCFEGEWPDVDELLAFKPWNKRNV